MTALEDLWYGNIRPTERTIRRGSELDNLLKLLCQNEDDLMKGLTDKQKKTLKSSRTVSQRLQITLKPKPLYQALP